MATSKGITRRDIITGAAGAAAAASVASCFPNVGGHWPDAPPPAPDLPQASCGCSGADAGTSSADDSPPSPVQGSSVVVTVQRDDSLDSKRKPVQEVVDQMVADMLSTLAGGEKNPWPKLLPNLNLSCARIGLKVNCLPAGIPTQQTLVRAVIKSLIDGGVCAGNIFYWERYLTDLTGAKYDQSTMLGATGIATADSSDANGAPVVVKMKGYGEPWGVVDGEKPGLKPRLSRVLTEQTDVTINLPVLKAHPEAGFTAALKNCYGMFDSPGKYHNPVLNEALPKLFAIPAIRKSVKLTIVDSLIASVTKDNVSPADRWPGRLFASTDPLALDYYALDLSNQLRAKKQPIAFPAIDTDLLGWMENAYKAGIGAKSYKLVTIGQQTDDGGTAPDGSGAPDTATIDTSASQSG